jgi:hypothetical protein
VWGPPEKSARADARTALRAQHHVGVRRTWEWPLLSRYRSVEQGVALTRKGAVAISRGYVPEFEDRRLIEIDTTFDDDTAEERVFAEILRAARVGRGASS